MKRIMTIVALMCAVAFQANAQNEAVEKLLKQAEEKVSLADKNPTNGKMQYEASAALINNDLGDKQDFERSKIYADRALKIAEEQTVLKDTLLGLTCYNLSMYYLAKKDWENAFKYGEKTMEAFERELGRHSPVTNGTKLIFGMFMMGADPVRAFPPVQEAFYDNAFTPENERIENMAEANIIQELALEYLIADHTKRFRYALPMITYNGKRQLLVQTSDWNMERPLVGWMVPSLLSTDEENKSEDDDEVIFCDDSLNFTVSPAEEKGKREITFNFFHRINSPRKLESKEGDARLWFLSPENYNKLLAAYREFKKNRK